MDYIKKIERINNHLRQHPSDYQSVIARMKLVSDAFDYEQKKKADYRLKRIAEVRRQLRGIRNGEEC